jgi:cytochrome c peroxidase
MTLRELRMWHWRECMKARVRQRTHEGRALSVSDNYAKDSYFYKKHMRPAKVACKEADFHLGAVQTLNNALDFYTTAEQDCAEEDNKSMMSN